MKKRGKAKALKKGEIKTSLVVLKAWLGDSSHFPHSLAFWSGAQPVRVGEAGLRRAPSI